MSRRLHVIGAGLAGLSAALRGLETGFAVTLYEASGQAGGRCRSYLDASLGMEIDNGNHLLLSGNRETLAYLDRIGARDTLTGPERARFPFRDLATGEQWVLKPGYLLPWTPARRAPGTSAADYLPWRLLTAGPEAVVEDCLTTGTALERVWRPLLVSALNTPLEQASARLAGRLLRETLLRGEVFCRPLVSRDSLGTSFIEPALAALERAAASVRYHHRLTGLVFDTDGVGTLSFGDGRVVLQPEDAVILALPPEQAAALLGLDLPLDHQPIVNGHFRFEVDGLPAGEAFLGLVGGTAEWLFRRNDILSTTTSAASMLADQPAGEIADLLWRDIVRALDLPAGIPLPPHRIVKEKRATLAQTPAMARARPSAATIWRNLALAGDWTDTGLPCTIEGAVRSGRLAVEAID
ncbi:hydroxysqualene dehydroxylase HpnE [Oceanibaculum sp.]|uniref:hydroxysqualene dehydroxylase HpnE n=1 Tax=Oceanibaculum sp. TaxID=1903597 RepID=UPI002589065A|nr:hydroxysqualene dehydroxylase HpnE [Oceanibaculum sp.]MCH2396072.1 hydroxysqualene dehydroxylase HpnE [Oceanibaculum sp.]